MYTEPMNPVCGVIEPGFANTCPRSISSRPTPRNNTPTLSPAIPESNVFRCISTPVTTDFRVSDNPTTSTSSPVFTTPAPHDPSPPSHDP
jgi:hypothetical protein